MVKSSARSDAPHPLTDHGVEDDIISLCISHPDEVIDLLLSSGITPENFYLNRNRIIYTTISDLHRRGVGVTWNTITLELAKNREWQAKFNDEAAERVTDRAATLSELKYLVDHFIQVATLRRINRVATRIATETTQLPEDFRAFVDEAETEFLNASANRTVTSMVPFSVAIAEAAGVAHLAVETKGGITGLASGFKGLDELTHGFSPGDMIILAARPSMGKTTLAVNIGENVAKGGTGVAVFSLEMSKALLGLKMLSSTMNVPFNRIRQGLVDHGLIDRAQEQLARLPIFIDDSADSSPSEIAAKARRLKQMHKIGFIIVDYLQLMKPSNANVPREQQVSEASRTLKGLAKSLQLPILVLAQLNRSPDVENRTPKLSDLRESGSLEQDADVVVLLSQHAVCKSGAGSVATDYIHCDVAKNRMGPVGDFALRFDRDMSRMKNLTPSDATFMKELGQSPAPKRRS